MNPTQAKVQKNLAGLEFLLSRPDTREMLPQSIELDKIEQAPAFYVCRAVMRDNLTVICVSLRVIIRAFTLGGDEDTRSVDIHGRGTTFEMALFDLAAQLIKTVADNEIIDVEKIPIHEERTIEHECTDTSIRSDKTDTVEPAFESAQQDERKGVAARGDNSSGRGADAKRDTKRRGKASNRRSGRGASKRSGGRPQ